MRKLMHVGVEMFLAGIVVVGLSTLRIHNRDGRIAEERTYPRSSDPRRTKG